MENINKELIIQDDEKIFAYCTLPDTVLRVTSKERDVDIMLSAINRSKMPEILTFYGYKTFDYYRVNKEIIIQSNIQESRDFCANAQQASEKDEKIRKLEEAIFLDNKNYQALSLLLDCHPYKSIDLIQSVQKNLLMDIEAMQDFLCQKIDYQKKITNTARIKQEYREIYSWRYVNAAKSEKFKQLGEIAFGEVIKYEIKKLQEQLDNLKITRDKIDAYFNNLRKLKDLTQFFGILIKKAILTEATLDFVAQSDTMDLLNSGENGFAKEAKKKFLNFIYTKYASTSGHNNENLLEPALDFIDWLHLQKMPIVKNFEKNLKDYLDSKKIEKRDQVERFCNELFKGEGII